MQKKWIGLGWPVGSSPKSLELGADIRLNFEKLTSLFYFRYNYSLRVLIPNQSCTESTAWGDHLELIPTCSEYSYSVSNSNDFCQKSKMENMTKVK